MPLSFVQDYALAVAEFEMADAKAQREAAEAATLRRKAEQLEGQAIELAEKWTGVHNLNWLCIPVFLGVISAGQWLSVWSSAAVYSDPATLLHKRSQGCLRLFAHLALCAAACCCSASPQALFVDVANPSMTAPKATGNLEESLPFQLPTLSLGSFPHSGWAAEWEMLLEVSQLLLWAFTERFVTARNGACVP